MSRMRRGRRGGGGPSGDEEEAAEEATTTTTRRPARRRRGGDRSGTGEAGCAARSHFPQLGWGFLLPFFFSKGDFLYLRTIFTFFYEGSLRIFTYVGPSPTDPRNTRAAKCIFGPNGGAHPDVGFVPPHTWFEGRRSTPIPEQLNKV